MSKQITEDNSYGVSRGLAQWKTDACSGVQMSEQETMASESGREDHPNARHGIADERLWE